MMKKRWIPSGKSKENNYRPPCRYDQGGVLLREVQLVFLPPPIIFPLNVKMTRKAMRI